MVMMKRYTLYIWMMMFTLLMVTSCTDHDFFGNEEEMVNVTYTIGFSGTAGGRAIGDGNNVDKLYIGIYENDKEIRRLEETIDNGKADVEITLFKDRTYDLVFWAQSSNTSVYDRTDLKNVTITYPEEMTLQEAANMDAFYLLKENVTVATGNDDGGNLTLTRPYAMLNIAATGDCAKVKKTELTVTYENESNPMRLVFTGSAIEGDYTYLASAFLKPGSIIASVRLLGEGDKEIKSFNVNEGSSFTLVKNYRYNVIGNVVVGWNGAIPEISPLTTDEQNRYIIDEEADLAWLSVADNTSTLSASTFVVTKETLDMANLEISSIQLPAGSTFDGGDCTIKNYANSLFGNATNITVQNLNLDHVVAESVDGHVGVLVNTLTGSGTFTDVSITNSSACTTNGAAGGMIGYIINKEEDATLEVTISGCRLTDNRVNGSLVSGVYVGRFRGYDNSESLTFSSNNNTSSAITETGTPSYYVTDNVAIWLADNDYSKYSGWLGDEEYYRGMVNYGEVRFVPKWDGVTKITPLSEGSTLLIHSAFDLASLQEASPLSVTFKTNADLGSHEFIPIRSITTLDGETHTVYNLKVDMVHDGIGAAFIQSAYGTTIHKDLTFIGADIKNVNDPNKTAPNYGNTDDGGAGNAYAGTFVSHTGGNYTIENVHVKKGKVYAVCKMGGLIGYVGGNLNMNNCSVDEYVVENFQPKDVNGEFIPNYYKLPGAGYMDIYLQQFQNNTATNAALAIIGIHKIPEYGRVNLLQWWYTHGEAGGLIGFVKSPKAIIDYCSVTNTEMKCIGQPNKTVVANVWDKNDFDTNNPFQSGEKIFAKGNTDIAGRHVNQFIGDVVSARSSETGTDYDVTISNYTVSGNKYFDEDAANTNEYNHNYASSKYCEVVGCAYYVGVDVGLGGITLKHVNDYAGSLTYYSRDGGESTMVTLTEEAGNGNGMAWMGGSFSDMKYTQKNTGSFLKPNWTYNVESEYPTYP